MVRSTGGGKLKQNARLLSSTPRFMSLVRNDVWRLSSQPAQRRPAPLFILPRRLRLCCFSVSCDTEQKERPRLASHSHFLCCSYDLSHTVCFQCSQRYTCATRALNALHRCRGEMDYKRHLISQRVTVSAQARGENPDPVRDGARS